MANRECFRIATRCRRLLPHKKPNIRCYSGDALLAELDEAHQQPEQTPAVREIPTEAAAVITRRSPGMMSMPGDLEAAVEADLRASFTVRSLRKKSTALTQDLRVRSRSRGRGGMHDAALLGRENHSQEDENARKADSALDALRSGSFIDVSRLKDALEELGDTGQQPAQLRRPKVPRLDYSREETLAYAAARLPACYAVACRVFDELRIRCPRFLPTSILDFGAGPGTAIWAAQHVWNNSLMTIRAVEASSHMASLGMRIMSLRNGGKEPGGSMQWWQQLGSKGDSWYQRPRGRYSIVVASYALGETLSPSERRRLVDALWRHTDGVLVLIEPGTPSGSATIRQARSQILEGERKKMQRVEAGVQAGSWLTGAHVVAPCPHDGRCPMDGTDSWCHFLQRFQRTGLQRMTKIQGQGPAPRAYQDERFSYVVISKGPRPEPELDVALARLPHSGAEEEVSDSQTDAAVGPPPPSFTPRAWQPQKGRKTGKAASQLAEGDALASGRTGDSWRDLELDEDTREYLLQTLVDEDDSDDEPAAFVAAELSAAARAASAPTSRSPVSAPSFPSSPTEGLPAASTTRTLGVGAHARSKSLSSGGVPSSSYMSPEGLQGHTANVTRVAAAAGQHAQPAASGSGGWPSESSGAVTDMDGGVACDGDPQGEFRGEFVSGWAHGGEGTVDGLRPSQDLKVGSRQGGAAQPGSPHDSVTPTVRVPGQPVDESGVVGEGTWLEDQRQVAGQAVDVEVRSGADVSEEEEEEDVSEREGDEPGEKEDVRGDPEAFWRDYEGGIALEAAVDASGQWSRIVRPPRRHARHVVLDLCSAAALPPSPPEQSGGAQGVERSPAHGVLLQQTVSRGDKRGWLGPAGYRLARRARWGDLWPSHLQDRALTRLLAVPGPGSRKKTRLARTLVD